MPSQSHGSSMMDDSLMNAHRRNEDTMDPAFFGPEPAAWAEMYYIYFVVGVFIAMLSAAIFRRRFIRNEIEYEASAIEMTRGGVDRAEIEEDRIARAEFHKNRSFFGTFWFTLSGTSIVLQITAIATVHATSVYIAGAIGLLVASVTMARENQLGDSDRIRRLINRMREQVNRFQREIDKFTARVSDLEERTSDLKQCEEKLEDIVKKQGGDVSTFLDLLQENRSILNGIKRNLQSRIAQDVISAALLSDMDGDFKVDEEEVDILVMRMSNVSGVTINVDVFKEKIRGGMMDDVVDFIKNLTDESSPEKDRIVVIDTKRAVRGYS